MSAFITVVGHLGRDAEIKSSDRGQFLTFTVCSSEYIGKEVTPVWYSVNSDAAHTMRISAYLKKGSNVVVSGSFAPVPYVRKDGGTGIDNKIFGAIVNFAGGSAKDGGTQQGTQQQQSVQQPTMGTFSNASAMGAQPAPQQNPMGDFKQNPPQGAVGAYGQVPPQQNPMGGYTQPAPQPALQQAQMGGYAQPAPQQGAAYGGNNYGGYGNPPMGNAPQTASDESLPF